MTTNLAAGDIAFTAYQSDNPDRFDFVLLVDVDAGTQISFTDSGWQATGGFRDTEGTAVWTAPADLSAGTVISSITNSAEFTGSVALSTDGDQIIAYQGSVAAPAFVAMIQMNGAFDPDATSSNSSALPPGLIAGISALAIDPEVDNARYDGSVTTGSQAELLAAINDPGNWVGDNSRQDDGPFVTSEDFGGDPPPPPPVPETVAIFEVQGNGRTSPLAGQSVTIEGIVTGDFQDGDADETRNLRGFFVQDADGDGDDATSDGIFVFDGSLATPVDPGDVVRVTGTVNEFFGETQITADSVDVIGSAELPAATAISFPSASTILSADGERIADLETVEGMLVTVSEPLFVTELFNYDRFGEIRASQGDRLFQFTNANAPSVAGFADHLEDIASRSLTIDDGLSIQNPDPIQRPQGGPLSTANAFRMGDEIADLVGNIRFSRGSGGSGDESFRLQLTEDATITSRNPRPEVPQVGGDLTVASFNVLNFFTTLDLPGNTTGPGGAFDPRGADSQAEFDRQLEKLVTALSRLNADIVGFQELENNGYGPDSAIATLTDALNQKVGAGTYAFVDPGTDFLGDDAIAVGFIYKTDSVGLADGTSVEFLTGPAFDGPNTSRSPLAATFEELATGETLTIAINHFKSKGGTGTGDDADANDGAGAFNGTRVRSSEALDAWLDSDPTGSGDDDFLILGDLNAYLQEDPVATLERLGYDNLLTRLGSSEPYSFVFDGQAGALDYAFSTGSLTGQVTGLAEYHLNADEADALDYNLDFGRPPEIFDGSVEFRLSDHDPLVIGLDLQSDAPLNVIAGDDRRNLLFGSREADEIDGKGGGDLIFGRAGDDMIIGGPGDDRIFAGDGDDTIRPATGRDRIFSGSGEDTVIVGDGDQGSVWSDFREGRDAGVLLTYEELLSDPATLAIDAGRIDLVEQRRDLQVRVDLDNDGNAETLAITLGRGAGASLEDVIVNPLETVVA